MHNMSVHAQYDRGDDNDGDGYGMDIVHVATHDFPFIKLAGPLCTKCKSGLPQLLKKMGLSDQLFLFASGHRDTGTSGPRTGGNMKIKTHHKLA